MSSVSCISLLPLPCEVIEKESLDGNYIVISAELHDASVSKILTYAIVDCGTREYECVDEEFVYANNLPLFKLQNACCLELKDGHPVESSQITHLSKFTMDINGHTKSIPVFITKLYHYPMVLGLP